MRVAAVSSNVSLVFPLGPHDSDSSSGSPSPVLARSRAGGLLRGHRLGALCALVPDVREVARAAAPAVRWDDPRSADRMGAERRPFRTWGLLEAGWHPGIEKSAGFLCAVAVLSASFVPFIAIHAVAELMSANPLTAAVGYLMSIPMMALLRRPRSFAGAKLPSAHAPACDQPSFEKSAILAASPARRAPASRVRSGVRASSGVVDQRVSRNTRSSSVANLPMATSAARVASSVVRPDAMSRSSRASFLESRGRPSSCSSGELRAPRARGAEPLG